MNTGRILEAMEEFYDESIEMRENGNPPTVGLAANSEREKQFLSQIKEWKSLDVTAFGVDSDSDTGTVLIELSFDFINTDDQPVRYEQVSVQHWKEGKITHERFYYDTGG